jgi:hypothetical protein
MRGTRQRRMIAAARTPSPMCSRLSGGEPHPGVPEAGPGTVTPPGPARTHGSGHGLRRHRGDPRGCDSSRGRLGRTCAGDRRAARAPAPRGAGSGEASDRRIVQVAGATLRSRHALTGAGPPPNRLAWRTGHNRLSPSQRVRRLRRHDLGDGRPSLAELHHLTAVLKSLAETAASLFCIFANTLARPAGGSALQPLDAGPGQPVPESRQDQETCPRVRAKSLS